MTTNRREFLGAGLAAALARKAHAARETDQGEWRNRQSRMAYRRLGRTNYMISEVICGGNTIAPTNNQHVELAIDMGLNYLDTAPAYGRGLSEQGYKPVIAGSKRDRVFLATKVSLWDDNRNRLYEQVFESLDDTEKKKLRAEARDEIEARKADAADYFLNYFAGQRRELEAASLANVMERRYSHKIDRRKNYHDLILQSVDESLTRLGTDHVDVLHCPHGANTPHEVLHFPEIFEAFEKLKKAGKARHLGVSAHTDPAGVLQAALDARVYSVAMIAYNICNHAYVDHVLERARRANFGVIAMKVARPVWNGRSPRIPDDPARQALIQKAVPGGLKIPQKAYLWVLQNPAVAAVNSELINAELVRDNLPLAGTKL
ncbi:MAG: aldo/keto reductase [Acidobacteria bacterium]|nr:aldo/keto reductase [Acidobacteriota bacterium]